MAMARLLGPDPSTRPAMRYTSARVWEGLAGKTLTVYLDEAGEDLASIAAYDPEAPSTPGSVISGSTIRVGSDSKVPLFWFPNNVDTVWAATRDGFMLRLTADVDARLDAAVAPGDISDLDGRIDTAESGITALDGRLDTAESTAISLDGRLDTAEGTLVTLDGRLDTAEADIDDLEAADADVFADSGYAATMPLISRLRMDKRTKATIVQIGDSTSSGQTSWPGLLTAAMAPLWPSWSFAYRDWSSDAATDYAAASVVSTGSGSGTCTMWNMAIPSTNTPNVLAGKFTKAVLSVDAPDLFIVSHGHNESSGSASADYDPAAYSAMAVMLSTLRLYWPAVPILLVLTNPVANASNSTQERRNDAYRRLALDTGAGVIDNYHVFTGAAGWSKSTPGAMMLDETHPNGTGNALIAASMLKYFSPPADTNSTFVPYGSVPQSPLAIRRTTYLTNGDFTQYPVSASAPTGWTAVGSPTLEKATSQVDTLATIPYSLHITGSGAAAGYLEQTLTTADVAGRTIAFTARVYVPTGAPAGGASGMLGIDVDGTETTTSSTNYGRAGWYWRSIHVHVPATATTVKVRLYGSTSSSVAGDAYFSESCLSIGALPARPLPVAGSVLAARDFAGFTPVNNTAADTVVATLTPPRGATAGKMYRFEVGGTLVNNSGGSINIVLKIKIGGTAVVQSGNLSIGANAETREWKMDAQILCLSTSSQKVSAVFAYSAADSSTWSGGSAVLPGYGTGSVNMATAQAVAFHVAPGSASNLFTMTGEWATLTEVN